MYRYTALLEPLHSFAGIALASCLAAGSASADELTVARSGNVEIGDFYGIVYYTETNDGRQVVTTVAADKEGLPVRFVATLQEGQRLLVSVPGDLSEFGHAIEFSRIDGKLRVTKMQTLPEIAGAAE